MLWPIVIEFPTSMSQPAKPPSIIDLYPEETREAAELLK